MLTLEQVANWVVELIPSLQNCIAVGTIDGNMDKFVGVYNDKNAAGGQRICIGGKAATRYQQKNVTLLVHWTRNPAEAEKKAIELYELLYGLSHVRIGGMPVVLVDPGRNPIPVGVDTHGVYEYVINLKIIYERTE